MSLTKGVWKSIHLIAEEGNLGLLEKLVEKRHDLSLHTEDGRTMLHIAALRAHHPFVKRLLSACPDLLDKTNADGWNALHFSVAGGDIQIFQELIESGLQIKTRDHDGLTCLHIAAQKGHIQMLKHILDICPDILHVTTNKGRSVIHEAVEGSHMHIFEELVKRGVNMKTKDQNGATCLHLAAARGHSKFVHEILKACPDIKEITCSNGSTALHEAASHGYIDVFEQLLKHGLSAYSHSRAFGTCLHSASFNGQIHMVKYILKICPDLLNATSGTECWTPLHQSAAGGHIEVFNELSSRGADPHCLTTYGGTIFHVAIAHGKCEMIRHLLTVCPDIADHPRIDGWTPLHQCASHGQINVFDTLINGCISVQEKTKEGETCLHIAASRGQNKMVKHIIHSLPGLVHCLKNDGRSALHEASAVGCIEAFDELINNGISYYVTSLTGDTCLHAAAIEGRSEMVSHILSSCKDLLYKTNNDGLTALHGSAASGKVEICNILCQKGLKNDMQTTSGKTVEDIAREHNQKKVLDFILQRDHNSQGRETNIQKQILDEEKINIYLRTLKQRKEKRRNIRLMIVGYEGVGKTTFCWRLMKKRLTEFQPQSTDGIDIYINRFLIDLDTNVREPLNTDNGLEISFNRIKDAVHRFCGQSQISTEDNESRGTYGRSVKRVTENEYKPNECDNSLSLDMSPKTAEVEIIYKNTFPTSDVYSDSNTNLESNRGDIGKVMSDIDLKNPQNITRKAYVSLWDFGGHKEFYNSHHLFLSSDAVYILIFNIYECLEDDEKKKKIQFWFESIKTHASHSAKSDHIQTPPIILIGTHIDMIKGGEKAQRKACMDMESLLRDDETIACIIKEHVTCFFAINTLTESEKKLDSIWQEIIAAAKYQSQWERLLPVTWLTLERELMKRRADGVKIMDVSEVITIGKELEEPVDNDADIYIFLEYLHLTGEILNFSGEKHKMEKIVLDPQWVVHAFRRLITAPRFEENYTSHEQLLWNYYKKTASLDPRVIKSAWSKDVDAKEEFLKHKDTLLYIMEIFGLIASPPVEQGEDGGSDIYFVPAFLEDANTTWLQPILNNPQTQISRTLCFVFTTRISFTILDKILAFCVQKFKPFHHRGYECKWIQRGLACFQINPRDNMVLHCAESEVKVTLFKLLSTQERNFNRGDGYYLRQILENTIDSVLQLSHQSHLKYQSFLSVDHFIIQNDERVQADEMLKYQELPMWNSDGKETMVTRHDYNIWFEKPISMDKASEPRFLHLTKEILNRQLTYQEMARVSKHIGDMYYILFCELELGCADIEEKRRQFGENNFQTVIIKMLNAWTEKYRERATIERLLTAMKMHNMPYKDAIKSLSYTQPLSLTEPRFLPLTRGTLNRQLTNQEMARVSKHIGDMYYALFCELELGCREMDNIRWECSGNHFQTFIIKLLDAWTKKYNKDATIERLLTAMKMYDMPYEDAIESLSNAHP